MFIKFQTWNSGYCIIGHSIYSQFHTEYRAIQSHNDTIQNNISTCMDSTNHTIKWIGSITKIIRATKGKIINLPLSRHLPHMVLATNDT